eukprot:TRINITY_DN5340_c0_g1_i1.p1 TRINITY_DN5340_c0_g1~~TRINITY_DN5340_c0_g1_i1.p1  ORF type:complete len:850 (-),score=184.74 TRINITY_DN5340_c0_g1_i1:448-2997(-)
MPDNLAVAVVLVSASELSEGTDMIEDEPRCFRSQHELLNAEFGMAPALSLPDSARPAKRLGKFCHASRGLPLRTSKAAPYYHSFIAYTGKIKPRNKRGSSSTSGSDSPSSATSSPLLSCGSTSSSASPSPVVFPSPSSHLRPESILHTTAYHPHNSSSLKRFLYCYCYRMYFPLCNQSRKNLKRMWNSADENLPEQLYEPHCIVILSTWAFHTTFGRLLQSATSMYTQADSPLCPAEVAERIFALLDGRRLPSTIAAGNRISFVRPAKGDLPLVDLNYMPLLRRFSASNIVLVLSAMLAEQKIVFVSATLQEITPSVECIRSLLHPFEWEHLYIPFVPPSYVDVCRTEEPFIVGMLRETWQRFDAYAGPVVFVDLDNGNISGDMVSRVPRIPTILLSRFTQTLNNLKSIAQEPRFHTYGSVLVSPSCVSPGKWLQCMSETSELSVDGDDEPEDDMDAQFGPLPFAGGLSMLGRVNGGGMRREAGTAPIRRSRSSPAEVQRERESAPEERPSSEQRMLPVHLVASSPLLAAARGDLGTHRYSALPLRARHESTLQNSLPRCTSLVAVRDGAFQGPASPARTQGTLLTVPRHTSFTSSSIKSENVPGQIATQFREVVLSVFVELLQSYRLFLTEGKDGEWFRSEDFIASLPPECKEFASSLLSTQLFLRFLVRRASGAYTDAFGYRLNECAQRAVAETRLTNLDGHLFKRGSLVRSWKWRYFVLEADGTLRYYKGDSTSRHEKGSFSIVAGRTYITIPQLSMQHRYPTAYPFELHSPARSLLMCAADNEARQRWVGALREHIRMVNLKQTLSLSVVPRASCSPHLALHIPCPASRDHYGTVMSQVDRDNQY